MNKKRVSLVALFCVSVLIAAFFAAFGEVSSAQVSTIEDRQTKLDADGRLAAELRRRTRRDVSFLNEKYTSNGVFLDFAGGYCGVAELGEDGRP